MKEIGRMELDKDMVCFIMLMAQNMMDIGKII